jgi:hypothetical protein
MENHGHETENPEMGPWAGVLVMITTPQRKRELQAKSPN